MVRHASIQDIVTSSTVLVLLTWAERCGGIVTSRIHSRDVDLVARMLEAQELGRNAGYWIILVRNVGEG